jgi:hypothetical protein
MAIYIDRSTPACRISSSKSNTVGCAHSPGLVVETTLALDGSLSIPSCPGVLSLLPDAFYRFLAVPNGVAMIGLGYSLWRSTRTEQVDATVGSHDRGRVRT